MVVLLGYNYRHKVMQSFKDIFSIHDSRGQRGSTVHHHVEGRGKNTNMAMATLKTTVAHIPHTNTTANPIQVGARNHSDHAFL